jgi:hypothetical protein
VAYRRMRHVALQTHKHTAGQVKAGCSQGHSLQKAVECALAEASEMQTDRSRSPIAVEQFRSEEQKT